MYRLNHVINIRWYQSEMMEMIKQLLSESLMGVPETTETHEGARPPTSKQTAPTIATFEKF